MWKCEKCNTLNWDTDNHCNTCKCIVGYLQDQAQQINAPQEVIEFIELLKKKEKQVIQLKEDADDKLMKAQKLATDHSKLIKESELLKDGIKKLRRDYDPLRVATDELTSQLKSARSALSNVESEHNKIEDDHKNKVQALTECAKDLEHKIEDLNSLYVALIIKHATGIAASLAIIVVTLIIAYLVYYTIRTAGKIEINISYNLGEILGAIFAGSGIAAAGLAYAKSVINKDNK